MAIVSFHRIASTDNLPTGSDIKDGGLYFVEDTQSFYKGKLTVTQPLEEGLPELESYELIPIKVLINGADATLSDADVLKVRNDDNTLSAAAQAKLDKPMDTEALYKTFATRSDIANRLKTYIVSGQELVYYDGTASSSDFNEEDIDPYSTLYGLNSSLRDGLTIVFLPKSKYTWEYTSSWGEDPETGEWTEQITSTPTGTNPSYIAVYKNSYYDYSSGSTVNEVGGANRVINVYDEYIYSVENNSWELIGDTGQIFLPTWGINSSSPYVSHSSWS